MFEILIWNFNFEIVIEYCEQMIACVHGPIDMQEAALTPSHQAQSKHCTRP
jgi:hypothetical protein